MFLFFYKNIHFYFSKQSDEYRLRIGNYSGTAGDAMRLSNKAEDGIFSTSDRNRNSEIIRQYSDYTGDFSNIYDNSGWWFAECMAGNLNGINYPLGKTRFLQVPRGGKGIFWYPFEDDNRSLKTVTMSISPINV